MITKEKVQARFAKCYTDMGGTKALPWAAIIQLVMTLLGGCSPKAAKRFATRHPEALQTMLENKLREESEISRTDVPLVAAAGVKVFSSSSVADIEAMM